MLISLLLYFVWNYAYNITKKYISLEKIMCKL